MRKRLDSTFNFKLEVVAYTCICTYIDVSAILCTRTRTRTCVFAGGTVYWPCFPSHTGKIDLPTLMLEGGLLEKW